MKTLITISITLFFGATSLVSTTDKDVYICKGTSSKRYHLKKNCRGLKRCSTNIYSVSLEDAKEMNRTLCGYED